MQPLLFTVCHVFFLIFSFRLTTSSSFRKIKDGKDVDVEMNFMVYLVKAPQSPREYDAWICGGAIVTSDFIVTSAACVEDVTYMYAIAGYDKYVNSKNVETDECTKNSRKKVVFTCVPKSYDLQYDAVQKWAFIDIAAVQVESPYDFTAKTAGCTWAPKMIDINYDPKYQEPNTDAMVLGWGHAEEWRLPGDTKDYNQEKLQYSSILLMSKSECKEYYKSFEGMSTIIDKYMICAMKEGNIDDKGDLRSKVTPDPTLIDGCQPGSVRAGGQCQPNREEMPRTKHQPLKEFRPQVNPFGYRIPESFRQNPLPRQQYEISPQLPFVNPTQNVNSYNVKEDITFDDIAFNFRRTNNSTQNGSYTYTRKTGICQNDHGGPIVTWVGKHEVLIGVASVFRVNRVNNSYQCNGPYLFTSTQCNGAFLNCVLNQAPTTTPGSDLPPTSAINTTTDTKTTDAKTTDAKTADATTTHATTSETPTIETPTTHKFKKLKYDHNAQLLFKRPNFQQFENNYEDGVVTSHIVEQPNYDQTFYHKRRASNICNLLPDQSGFDIVERRISWRNHPDGPAQNELIEDLFYRPVRPLGASYK